MLMQAFCDEHGVPQRTSCGLKPLERELYLDRKMRTFYRNNFSHRYLLGRMCAWYLLVCEPGLFMPKSVVDVRCQEAGEVPMDRPTPIRGSRDQGL